jgi:hypothetical protein
MPSLRTHCLRTHFAHAAAPALLALAGAPAAAQPFTGHLAFGNVSSDTPPSGLACGTQTQVPGPGTTVASCSFSAGEFFVLGSAVDGRVSARASVTGHHSGTPTGKIFHAFAQGVWGDRMTFTGLVPSTVRMDVQWDGFLIADAVGEASTTAGASWSFGATSQIGSQLAEYHDSRTIVAAGLSNSGAPPHATEAVLDQKSFFLTVVGSTTTAPPFIDFGLFLSARGTVAAGTASAAGVADADFASTGLITGLAFFDAAGADITGSVLFTFARGTLVGPVVTAAPEPATVALLGGGALLLGIVARRRHG